MTDLRMELSQLLNRHSRENASNTPDFILTEYMLACLEAFEKASNHREAWYGKRLRIGMDSDDGRIKPTTLR